MVSSLDHVNVDMLLGLSLDASTVYKQSTFAALPCLILYVNGIFQNCGITAAWSECERSSLLDHCAHALVAVGAQMTRQWSSTVVSDQRVS
jgi:hypothetical protein